MILQLPTRTLRVRAMYPGEARGFKAVGLYYVAPPKEIAIDGEQPPQAQADTLIHECIHALWEDLGLGIRATEETVASKFGAALTALFRLNPGLLVILTAAIHYDQPIFKGEPA